MKRPSQTVLIAFAAGAAVSAAASVSAHLLTAKEPDYHTYLVIYDPEGPNARDDDYKSPAKGMEIFRRCGAMRIGATMPNDGAVGSYVEIKREHDESISCAMFEAAKDKLRTGIHFDKEPIASPRLLVW